VTCLWSCLQCHQKPSLILVSSYAIFGSAWQQNLSLAMLVIVSHLGSSLSSWDIFGFETIEVYF
jgi:hypothetical protein